MHLLFSHKLIVELPENREGEGDRREKMANFKYKPPDLSDFFDLTKDFKKVVIQVISISFLFHPDVLF